MERSNMWKTIIANLLLIYTIITTKITDIKV